MSFAKDVNASGWKYNSHCMMAICNLIIDVLNANFYSSHSFFIILFLVILLLMLEIKFITLRATHTRANYYTRIEEI